MLDHLNLFELVLLTLSLMGGVWYAGRALLHRLARRYRQWRTRRFLQACQMASPTPRPRLVPKTAHVAAAQNLRVRVRLSDSQTRFSEQSGYLGTTLRISDQQDDTRVGRTARTGPSPYRINGSESHSG